MQEYSRCHAHTRIYWRTIEEVAEFGDVPSVGINGGLGHISDFHILGHAIDVAVESVLVGSHCDCILDSGISSKGQSPELTARRCIEGATQLPDRADWL